MTVFVLSNGILTIISPQRHSPPHLFRATRFLFEGKGKPGNPDTHGVRKPSQPMAALLQRARLTDPFGHTGLVRRFRPRRPETSSRSSSGQNLCSCRKLAKLWIKARCGMQKPELHRGRAVSPIRTPPVRRHQISREEKLGSR